MINIKNLQYMIAVESEQNITKAAEKLFISQPSLSLHLHHIEEECKVKLFVRKARGVELTEAGEIFLTYAKRIVAEYAELEQAMIQIREQREGKLVVELASAAYTEHFAFALQQLRQELPQTQVVIGGLFPPKESIRHLELGTTHLIITHSSPLTQGHEGIIMERLHHDELGLLLHRGSPLHQRLTFVYGDDLPHIDARHLADEPLILFREDSNIGFITAQILRAAHISEPHILNYSHYEPQLLRCDYASAILPKSACQNMAGVFVRIDTPIITDYWTCMAYKENLLTPATRTLVRILRRVYGVSNQVPPSYPATGEAQEET